MVKTKNKKRVTADVLTIKKAITRVKKHNPFEVHTNKEKFTIMGRQLKHDKGMPGVSRAKALKRRKDTIGQEYLHKDKANSFKDKRIGEKYMTKEEAVSARFVAERLNQSQNKKQSLFNLNDDDAMVLTHKGQTLEEIEQFADTISDDGDDDEEIGKLDAQYTGMAHFGNDKIDQQDGQPGRKSAIDDLIADQKRRKNEISKEKDEISQLTHRLDENWRSLIPLMSKMSKEDEVKPKPDDYDRALREMIFEPRGAVSDKLKSEAEIVKDEKERLERLERERLERMQGLTDEEKKAKHRSADDLDDGYFLQPVVADQPTLAYDIKGKANNDDDSDVDPFEEDEKVNGNGVEKKENSSGDDEDSGEEDDEEASGSSSDEQDNLSDLKYDSESEAEGSVKKPMSDKEIAPKRVQTPIKKVTTEQDRLRMMEKAAAELPYTFEMPDSYEELEDVFKNQNAEFQSVILERMIKCNHPKIAHENKARMVTLFAYLMQHVNDTFESVTVCNLESRFSIADRLCPFLYDLSQINPAETTQCFKEVIKEKQSDYRSDIKTYPSLDTLVFLKLASALYSTSDFRHHIVTPCFIFISEMLTRCRLNTRADIAKGLFLVTIVLEYTQLSKRFLPAALSYLAGVIYLCIPKRTVEVIQVVPPFKSTGEQNSLLVLTQKCSSSSKRAEQLRSIDLIEKDLDDSAKVRILNSTLRLTHAFLELLADHVGAQYLSAPITRYLDRLSSIDLYPQCVRDNVAKCREIIETIDSKPFAYIVAAEKKPKALRMLEPKFEKVYDDKRSRRPGNKDKIVQQGMIRKIKSETRGAIREIRRDNAFLAKIQLKKQMHSDAERKEKVKRIFSEASIQQGELNAMDRKKKHM